MSGFAELLPGMHTQSKLAVELDPPLVIEGRKVYPFGQDGRPVFALHELPGFTPQFIAFCRELASEGFKVYAPLLFGEAGKTATLRNLWRAAFDRDWYVMKNATPRIIEELRRLADAIHALHPGNMGAIGMCFTGQLPAALLDRPYMKAAVLSQPSMPFLGNAEMALDPGDVEAAKRSQVPMIAFRFKTDRVCRRARQVRFETTFDRQIDFEALPADEQKHAVLTEELFDEDGNKKSGPSVQALAKTVDYLRRQL
jgi:dienelactone hydrolase